MAADKAKVYGLILPKKKPELTKTRPAQPAFNVFGNESDEDTKPDAHKSYTGQIAGPNKIKKQTQVDIDKALLEDSTVYEYDAIYDEMQASKPKVGIKEKEKSNTEKTPRYIKGLLKAAEQKKKDEERRKERKVQKEREQEGEMYADKEKFVTSAYKEKMLEMQEEEEKEKREAAIEALIDVTKQKDMSGFYRYLYRQTGAVEVPSASGDDKIVKKEDTESTDVKTELDASPRARSQHSSGTSSPSKPPSSNGDDSEVEAARSKKKSEVFKSNYTKAGSSFRKKAASSSSSESEESTGKSNAKKSYQRQTFRSRSKSLSPHRKKHGRDYSSQESKNKNGPRSHLHSSTGDKRRIDRSRSRERLSKDQRSSEYARKNRRSREKSRRSRSREKSRRSRSREKSRRSRSIEKHRKDSRNKQSSIDKRQYATSSSPSSDDSSKKGSSVRLKSTNKEKTLQKLGKNEIAEKSKSLEKHNTNLNEKVSTTQTLSDDGVDATQTLSDDGVDATQTLSDDGVDSTQTLSDDGVDSTQTLSDDGVDATQTLSDDGVDATQTLSDDGVDSTVKRDKNEIVRDMNTETSMERPAKPIPVAPAKKVYPHHNSSQDIAEARKRYLQRKIAREGAT